MQRNLTARLIHWSGTTPGVCVRKDSGVDAHSIVTKTTVLTFSGFAHHRENVTCPRCRRFERDTWALLTHPTLQDARLRGRRSLKSKRRIG